MWCDVDSWCRDINEEMGTSVTTNSKCHIHYLVSQGWGLSNFLLRQVSEFFALYCNQRVHDLDLALWSELRDLASRNVEVQTFYLLTAGIDINSHLNNKLLHGLIYKKSDRIESNFITFRSCFESHMYLEDLQPKYDPLSQQFEKSFLRWNSPLRVFAVVLVISSMNYTFCKLFAPHQSWNYIEGL